MTVTSTSLYLVGLTFLAYFCISIYDSYSIKNVDDFFLVGRQLSSSGFVLNAVGTNYSFLTAVFVLSFWGLTFGGGAWWSIVTFALSFFLFSIQRFSLAGEADFLKHGNTVHEFIGNRFSSRLLRVVTSLATSFAYLGYFIASIYVAATFFAPAVGVGVWPLVLLVATATIVYTTLGGFKSVVKTDIIQIILILVGSTVIFYAILSSDVSLVSVFERSLNAREFLQPERGFIYILALFLINGLWNFFAMDMWQRSISTGETESVIKGSLSSGVVWSLISIPAVLLGVFVGLAHQGGAIETPTALMQTFVGFLESSWAVALFYTSLVGALISSQDSNLAALAQTLYTDVWSPSSNRQPKNEGSNFSLSDARWTVVLSGSFGVGLLYAVVKLLDFNLVTFLLTFFSAQLILFPLVFIGTYTDNIRMPSGYAIASIVIGFIASFGFGLYSVVHPSLQFWVPLVGLSGSLLPLIAYAVKKLSSNQTATKPSQ